MQQAQIVDYQSPRFGGPYGLQAYLIPPQFTQKVVFEGPWIPIAGAKAASLEIAGSLGGGTISLQLVGTNDPVVAGINRYTVTLGGSVTTGDTITATFTNPNLPAGSEAVTYTTIGGDTTTTIATALAAAINADTNLQSVGIGATSAAAVVTIEFPSITYQSPAPAVGSNPASSGSSQGYANFTIVAMTIGGSATETATVAADTNGTPLPASAIGSGANPIVGASFPGLIALSAPYPLFIKARMAAMSGTSPSVTASLTAAV